MVDKSNPLKSYTNGEILTAEDLSTSLQDVGAVQYLVPYNSSLSKDSAGVVFLGTTAYAFAGIVLKTGYKLLQSDGVNTTEITLSGAGASGLSTIELKSHNEKQGVFYPISESNYINESYTNTEIGMCRLGKSYGTGDGTRMLLHPDYQSVSKCNATADGTGNWSAVGANSTVTVGGTASIESGAAIYATVAATTTENGMRFILGTNTVSLIDSKLRFGWYIGALTNISHVKVKITDSAGTASSSYWELTAQASGSSLVAGAWNFMEVDMKSTATGSAGTLSTSTAKQFHIVTTPTSSQSFQMAVDDLCIVDGNELKLPGIWQIADATNTQLAYINSGSKGTYQLGTTILNNYSLETSELKKKWGTISNNQNNFPSGSGVIEYSGNLAKEIWTIREKWLPSNVSNATELWSDRFNSPNYEVIDVPSSSSLKLKINSGTGDVLSFVAGDQFTVYAKEWNGNEYDSPRNSTFGKNFKIFTLSGSSTVSGEEITVNHVESNSGVDANGKFFAVNNVSEMYSKIETATENNSLVKLTPTIFLPKEEGVVYPSGLHSHWKLNESSGNAINSKAGASYNLTQVGTVLSAAGKLGLARGVYSASNYFEWSAGGSASTIYDGVTFVVEAWVKSSVTGALQTIICKGNATTQGWLLGINTDNTLIAYLNGTPYTTVVNVCDGNWHYVVWALLSTAATADKNRIYINGANRYSGNGTTFTGHTGNLRIGFSSAGAYHAAGSVIGSAAYSNIIPATTADLELNIANRYEKGKGREYGENIGYYARGSVSSRTGNKYTLARKLKRQSTAIENPYDLQFDGILS